VSDECASCGHDRVFHREGTGNGVPIGKGYCDDRYSDPCNCTGFVEAGVEPPGPDRADELQDALQALVDVVDRIGGYMTPEDQRVLWRARSLSRGGR
jgi:hypothetical protein